VFHYLVPAVISVYYPHPALFLIATLMDTASLPRILGAIFYDLIIVFSIIFIAAQWFPLVPEHLQNSLVLTLFKQIYMLGISFLYFAYSWQHGGQTIGMKSWRIKLLADNTAQRSSRHDKQMAIAWRQSAIRYLIAIVSWLVVGMGFTWIIFSPQHKSWHDMASGTHLVVLPKI
jgi:uncharacterized RDD family membrane protein YckC